MLHLPQIYISPLLGFKKNFQQTSSVTPSSLNFELHLEIISKSTQEACFHYIHAITQGGQPCAHN